ASHRRRPGGLLQGPPGGVHAAGAAARPRRPPAVGQRPVPDGLRRRGGDGLPGAAAGVPPAGKAAGRPPPGPGGARRGGGGAEGAKARAEAALQRVKGGQDFAQVAREASEDTTTAPRGGELGFLSRGEMMAPFEDLAFGLKSGEVGGPVRTAYGYHVVKVLE